MSEIYFEHPHKQVAFQKELMLLKPFLKRSLRDSIFLTMPFDKVDPEALRR
jgi:hypothetical protein